MGRRILILGGTRDARKLAELLVDAGHTVTTSLAGVTDEPKLPVGELRVGGFGGAGGLAKYLRDSGIEILVDATHPFAAVISGNAHTAASDVGVRLLRLERPPWETADGEQWIVVETIDAAAAALRPGVCALVTIGRKEIAPFAARGDIRLVARMIEPPDVHMPVGSRLVLARPPFSVDDEEALMRQERVDVLVSKNAGGPGRAKLDAARRLGIPVIMVARPGLPPAETAKTPEELAQRIGEDE